MQRFSTWMYVGLCAVTLACGGGGGGGGSAECAKLATAVNTCIEGFGGTADSTIQSQCDATVCDGSRATAIDCIINTPCGTDGDAYQIATDACLTGQQCKDAASCAGVANLVTSCDDTAAWSEVKAQCNSVTCTGSKQTALECIVALDCGSLETDAEACLIDNGCTPPPSIR